ncbi:phosphoribosylamine--glycine ligase [Roseivirga pacifica]|uniref:phosphoribosylamine--glycine ligase n=1 Tax=Roseivirga pacifica TaxID=1267423 RepID=UPI0020952409|nr:phosphoribosylamine--glycine ligase [Roseivirga pacifica]MCO6358744.1 phosphoribosylamine--glycine ligase [Roseivirga pacifica]MCO6365620.1 phosphoribosylamine--glycine ligase [Roseivirga pacifica]MCO6371650.1 phosphoribosylamine--glycine ligase [Roseivirga pacifica]MCO6376239.1 phosphoribosylamine--glycine ligase [Roseivirga pacifica]MCO6379028.1 phosphoribosylamine--glycine ligase [Roseivirga pacifica]
MNILVLGSGGREHAFSWKISQSNHCDKLFIAPGNAGTAGLGTNVAINVNDFEAIGKFVLENDIEMVVVGPEDPLVNGIKDYFLADETLSKIAVVGPPKAGARLEGSKDFSKQFMDKYKVPTARSKTFTKDTLEEGLNYVSSHPTPVVLKADGLAAGKGVIIAQTNEEARETLKEMLVDAKFGEASSRVVIEQFLEGIEVSVFVLTDGKNYKILPEAKDYKRIGENDEGLNTGGMGAVTPVPFADADFMSKVEERIIKPTVNGLAAEGIEYTGFIFIGLMSMNGEPYVIEYNVRMGDPETQAVFTRIDSDMVELLKASTNQSLDKVPYSISEETATTVVMVSGGYPGSYEKGNVISGIDSVESATVFHAGTKLSDAGEVLTNGGRVLALTGKGDSVENALENAYNGVAQISWKDEYHRKDIGQDILKLLK